jgi:hypothetical protein
LKLIPFGFQIVVYQPLFSGSLAVAFIFFKSYLFKSCIDIDGHTCTVKLITFAKLLLPHAPLHRIYHSTTRIKLAGNVYWTKTGTTPASIARLEPSNAIGIQTENVGATFETIADEMNGEKVNQKMNHIHVNLETMNDKIKTKNVPCGMKSPRQLIANTKVIDATVITAVTKSNENEMGRDCPMPTNDAALDHIDSEFAGTVLGMWGEQ